VRKRYFTVTDNHKTIAIHNLFNFNFKIHKKPKVGTIENSRLVIHATERRATAGVLTESPDHKGDSLSSNILSLDEIISQLVMHRTRVSLMERVIIFSGC
jgi:hypothetical protein